MNLNNQDLTRTTLEKPTVAYIYTRTKEHSSQNTSEIYNHNEFNYIKNILQISPYDDTTINCSLTDLISTYTKIIHKSGHRSLPLYLESIAINRHKPTLNHGTKASK